MLLSPYRVPLCLLLSISEFAPNVLVGQEYKFRRKSYKELLFVVVNKYWICVIETLLIWDNCWLEKDAAPCLQQKPELC